MTGDRDSFRGTSTSAAVTAKSNRADGIWASRAPSSAPLKQALPNQAYADIEDTACRLNGGGGKVIRLCGRVTSFKRPDLAFRVHQGAGRCRNCRSTASDSALF